MGVKVKNNSYKSESTIDLTLWFFKKPARFNDLYNILKEFSFFHPSYFDGPFDAEDSYKKTKKYSSEEVEMMFYESYKKVPDAVVTFGSDDFSIMIMISEERFSTIIISASYAALKKHDAFKEYELLFIKLIDLFDPFYGIIDELYNSSIILQRAKEETYKPNEYVQALYWGNYFGKEYSSCEKIKKIIENDLCISQRVNQGWFVKFGEDCSGCLDKLVQVNRQKLNKYICSKFLRTFYNCFSK